MSIATETQRTWFTTYVQSLMSAIVGKEAQPDSDGDYPISGDTACGWVRPDVQRPWGVQILIIAARGVPTRLATLREINEINAREMLANVALQPDGVVTVTYRLLADAVNEENLHSAMGRLLTIADDVGPMLAAVHGGWTPIPAEQESSDVEDG